VSVDTAETESDASAKVPQISADGRYVTFYSEATNLVAGDTNGIRDVFVRDTVKTTTNRLSVAEDGTEANDSSVVPAISGDGAYVTFSSEATDLVTSDTSNNYDVFRVPISESVGQVLVSANSDRSAVTTLAGSIQSGDVYIFAEPPTGKIVTSVDFYLDGVLVQTESNPPYDFNGGDVDAADPFDVTSELSAGDHRIKAVFRTATGGGSTKVTFTVR